MNEDQSSPEPSSFDRLDRGLRAGFSRDAPSILSLLERRTKSCLRLTLPDAASEQEPILRPLESTRPRRASSRYEIVGEIARGGLGTILKGRDVDLGRDVAIKVLHERFAEDRLVIERFVEEAQIGGQLQHPGIVPVYELGLQADERPFFAMKLVKGQTLAELLRRNPERGPSSTRFLTIFLQVCQTVAYAHSRRVIHRDLKPSNILVGSFGEVQIVDWGLAKVLHRSGDVDPEPSAEKASVIETVRSTEGSSASIAGSVMGTPAYMPPEQACGNVDSLDERTDVFALGAILFEILVGRPLYSASPKEALSAAAAGNQEEALAALDTSEADHELQQLARQCLDPEQARRPGDAAAVASRIEAYLTSIEQRARRAEVQTAVLRVRTRSTLLIASLLLVSLVVGGGAWTIAQESLFERKQATASRANLKVAEAERLAGQAMQAGLGGGPLWSKAVSVARTASQIVAAGEADPELVGRVSALVSDLEEKEEQTRAEALREASHDVSIERLFEVRIGPDEVQFDFRDGAARRERESTRRAREYAALFREIGIDPDSEDVNDQLKRFDCEHRTDLARALDAWAESVRVSAEYDESLSPASWQRILRLSRRLDPDDAWRNALRNELVRAELDARALRALSSPEKLSGRSPEEIAIGVSLLETAGDLEGAVAAQLHGMNTHPSDYWLQISFPDLLSSEELMAERYSQEMSQAAAAAFSLRPSSRKARFTVLMASRTNGAAARELAAELEKEEPTDPVVRSFRYFFTMSSGDFEAAKGLLPDSLEALEQTGFLWDYAQLLLSEGHGDTLLEAAPTPLHSACVLIALERYEEAWEVLQTLASEAAEMPSWYLLSWPRFLEASSADELRAVQQRHLALAGASHETIRSLSAREALAAAETLRVAWRDLPTAIRLYSHAFELEPALKEQRRFVRLRVEAASFAALASTDASPASTELSADERRKLRSQARAWLHEELDFIEAQMSQGPLAPSEADLTIRTLNGLSSYGWLAPIREDTYLAQLDAEEAHACRFLWARLEGVHKTFTKLLGS